MSYVLLGSGMDTFVISIMLPTAQKGAKNEEVGSYPYLIIAEGEKKRYQNRRKERLAIFY